MLSDQGNPQLLSLTAVLRELGLRLQLNSRLNTPDKGGVQWTAK